jgi:hypothetical protein
MRRSASEIINSLENRISRLEKSARPTNIGVDKVIDKTGYIHLFSSDHLTLSVPSRSANDAKRAIEETGGGEENPFIENEITYKMNKLGHMTTFIVSSPGWLRAHDVVLSLKQAGFFLVSHDNWK